MRLFWKAFAVGGAGLVLAGPMTALPTSDAATALRLERLFGGVCGPGRGGGALTSSLLVASAVAAPASRAQPIPLYPDLTTSPFKAGTDDAVAQAYFSQGLTLAYGFNHAGAVRSFREAQSRDPECAACWWGEAMAMTSPLGAQMLLRPMKVVPRSSPMRLTAR